MNLAEAIIKATVRAGTPLLFATLGSIIVERSGVMNLGLEGYMLLGAVGGFATAYLTGNLFLALLVAALMGAILAAIHAFLSITLKVNQVVSGLAIAMLGTGLSGVWGRDYIGKVAEQFKPIALPFLSEIPIIGDPFFNQDIMVYMSYLLVPLIWFFLFRTKWGMATRAVGEAPSAADSKGINVFKVRYISTIVGSSITALGGAYLSLAYTSMWVENMTAGRGWIAIALVIFATWHPTKALLGAYLFGGVMALQLRLQTLGVEVSSQLLMMLPYLVTLVVIVLFNSNERLRRKMGIPKKIGIPYSREEKD